MRWDTLHGKSGHPSYWWVDWTHCRYWEISELCKSRKYVDKLNKGGGRHSIICDPGDMEKKWYMGCILKILRGSGESQKWAGQKRGKNTPEERAIFRSLGVNTYSSTFCQTASSGTSVPNEAIWRNVELLILKTIGNRKGDCAWSCSRWQTQPEKICKSQRTNQCHSLRTLYWFVLCNLQIFSGCVCHLEQLHAQSPFLFPIVFSINSCWVSRAR